MKVLCLLFASFGWCLEECGSCMMKCDWMEQLLPCQYDQNKELMKDCNISEPDVKIVKAKVIRPHHQVFENSLCAQFKPAREEIKRISYRVRFYDWNSDELEHEDVGFNIPDLSDFMAFEKPRKVIVDVFAKGFGIPGKCTSYNNRYYGPMNFFLPPMAIVNNGIIRSDGYYKGEMMIYTHYNNNNKWNETECGKPILKFQAHSSDRPGFLCNGFKSVTPEYESPILRGGVVSVDRLQHWLSLNTTAKAKTFTITQLPGNCVVNGFAVTIGKRRSVTLINEAAKRLKGDL